MKKTFRIAIAAFATFAAALCLVPQPTMAAETSVSLDTITQTDSVGNVYATGDTTIFDNSVSEKDFILGGADCRISNSEIKQDALVCGNQIAFSANDIGGSLRAAGYAIAIDDTAVAQNITAAGRDITIDSETTADAVILAAQTVNFDGTCGDLKIFAGYVTVDGVITGDALIYADNVTIAESAVINGTLKIESGNEPVVYDGATVNNLDFVQTVSTSTVETVSIGVEIAHKLLSRVYWIPALALVAFIFCLVLGKALNGSADMLLKKPAVMLGSGAVTLLAIPVTIVLLCVTYIGLPLAGLLTLLMLPIMFFAVTFTGASAGRLVFKTLHPWLASIIGTAILVFVRIIPFLGGLVLLASLIYTLGYFIQSAYAEIKTSNKKKESDGQTAAASTLPENTEA